MLDNAFNLSGQHIHFRNTVDLISKELHTDRCIGIVRRENLKNIPVYAECSSLKIHLIACILHINESLDYIVTVNLHARSQRNHHVHIIIRTADSIDAGNGCHNDHILALRQSRRRRKTQLIDLIIDCRILRNIGVRLRHISFRLIIIIIGHEILYCILREEFFKLTI